MKKSRGKGEGRKERGNRSCQISVKSYYKFTCTMSSTKLIYGRGPISLVYLCSLGTRLGINLFRTLSAIYIHKMLYDTTHEH